MRVAVGRGEVATRPKSQDGRRVVPHALLSLAQRRDGIALDVALPESGGIVGLRVDHRESRGRRDRAATAVLPLGRPVRRSQRPEERLLAAVHHRRRPVVLVAVRGRPVQAPAVDPIGVLECPRYRGSDSRCHGRSRRPRSRRSPRHGPSTRWHSASTPSTTVAPAAAAASATRSALVRYPEVMLPTGPTMIATFGLAAATGDGRRTGTAPPMDAQTPGRWQRWRGRVRERAMGAPGPGNSESDQPYGRSGRIPMARWSAWSPDPSGHVPDRTAAAQPWLKSSTISSRSAPATSKAGRTKAVWVSALSSSSTACTVPMSRPPG